MPALRQDNVSPKFCKLKKATHLSNNFLNISGVPGQRGNSGGMEEKYQIRSLTVSAHLTSLVWIRPMKDLFLGSTIVRTATKLGEKLPIYGSFMRPRHKPNISFGRRRPSNPTRRQIEKLIHRPRKVGSPVYAIIAA